MTLTEFQQKTLITWNIAPKKDLQIVNAVMGISDEIGEVVENIKDKTSIVMECGDVLYYCVVLLHLVDEQVKYNELHNAESSDLIYDLVINSSIITGYIKKFYFHGHELNKELIISYVYLIMTDIEVLLYQNDSNLNESMEAVINKLNKRYGDKFEEAKSINRTI